jgi:type II secretory pathway component PulL
MSNHILAVHLGLDTVALAVAQSTLRTLRIQMLASLERGSDALVEIVHSRPWDRVIASVPGDTAVFRFLDFPFRDRTRLRQAVGPALEAHVPLALEDAVTAWDFTSADRRGSVLAAMVPRTALERHRAALAELGLRVDRLVWEPSATLEVYRRAADARTFTAIDLGTDGAIVASFVDGRLRAMRVAARADEDATVRTVGWFLRTLELPGARALVGGARADVLLPALREAAAGLVLEPLGERCPVEIADAAASAWRSSTAVVGLALAAGGDTAPPLLEVGGEETAVARTQARSAARRLAPWAGATAALLLAAGVLDYARLDRRRDRLEAGAQRIYGSAMPGGASAPGQRLKMESRVAELERRLEETAGGGGRATPLAVLAEMSAAVPADLRIEFDLFAYDPPAARLRGRGASFEAVTRLQEILRASGRFSSVEVSNVRAGVSEGVEFELALTVAAGRPA